jgi:hypothetical protein
VIRVFGWLALLAHLPSACHFPGGRGLDLIRPP